MADDRSFRTAEGKAAIMFMVCLDPGNPTSNMLIYLDNVFSPHDGNARVYDNAAKRLVRRVMEGYNGTVFAYGMTGTGKTFSMQGTANQPGTIPLAITDIFSYIRENPEREFLLRVSYLEIYNEKIFDLLNQSTPGTQQEEIKLREDSKRGVYASPLKEEIVQSPNQLLRVISRGDQARRVGSTQFNARSSRSHAVVQIVVESRERIASQGVSDPRRQDKIVPGGVLVSTLSLIDLAGSEKAALNKERRTEGAHINKSLLTLGTVIARLTGDEDKDDGAKTADKEKGLKHLPYRDSKLTRLLQPALSGDSLVSILCTIQLSSATTSAASTGAHTAETLNTLKFASRAKNNLVSHAKKNESNTSGDPNSRALLDRYRLEIQELRAQLDAQNKAKAEAEEEDELEVDRKKEAELERQERTRHEEQMLEMQLARTALKERIGHLNRLILSSKSLGVNSGRYSSASMPLHRMSSYSHASQPEFGRPVSLRSRDSMNSRRDSRPGSYRDSARNSTATLEVPNVDEHSLQRKFSTGSITTGVLPAAQPSQLAEESEDEDDSAGPRGNGEASLIRQNGMLQADLADKNRYIATLEKRLIQTRHNSQSRASMSFSNTAGTGAVEYHDTESLVREKDREIDELRAKLDDQTRMVQALRSAARKRETLEGGQKSVPTIHASTQTTAVSPRKPVLAHRTDDDVFLPQLAPRMASRQDHYRSPSINSHVSNTSSNRNHHAKTLSPVALLSPSRSHDPPPTSDPAHIKAAAAAAKLQGVTRRRSVDEMTALLDQMISDKIEQGHMVRGERGSLRAKRDTVMEKLSLSPPINVERPSEAGAQEDE
jgi:centromeric protein E